MSKRGTWTLIGFILFCIGVLSLVINMVGLNFSFLGWVESFGRLGAFLFKLSMIVGGLVMVALANAGKEEDYDEFFDGAKNKRN